MEQSSYNLFTPARNEEDHLPKLAECVMNQTHLPDVWMIVDHKSSDNTPKIIDKLTSEYDWIYSVRYEEENTRGKYFAEVCRMGFEKSLRLSNDVEYLIKVDADARFHESTFKEMIIEMNDNENLAIASPRLMQLKKEINVEKLKEPNDILENQSELVIKSDKNRTQEPTDGIRIYRKNFLKEIGGYYVTDFQIAHDPLILAKAEMNGYEVSFLDTIWGCLIRETNINTPNVFNHGKYKGHSVYVSRYSPIAALLRLSWKIFNSPYRGIGELVGYFESFINQEERIDDEDIIEYNRNVRLKKILDWL